MPNKPNPLTALRDALTSARRFSGKTVYPDTIQHWNDALATARNLLDKGYAPDAGLIRRLADELEAELKLRG